MISITREETKLTKLTIHTEHKGKTDCIYIGISCHNIILVKYHFLIRLGRNSA